MITVLFGQPHSGKSTIAKQLKGHNIDGDNLRELFSNKDYSKEGRIKNLDSIGYNVILSLVYPYKEAREYLNNLCNEVKWIYLTYDEKRGRESFHVEDFDYPSKENVLHLNTSKLSIEECVNKIKSI